MHVNCIAFCYTQIIIKQLLLKIITSAITVVLLTYIIYQKIAITTLKNH